MKAASDRGSTVCGVNHMVEDRRWVAVDDRIEESINLSREEVRSSVRMSREIDPIGVGNNRWLARPHGAVEGLHETTIDVTVVRSVNSRRILLMRVLRIWCWYVHHADW